MMRRSYTHVTATTGYVLESSVLISLFYQDQTTSAPARCFLASIVFDGSFCTNLVRQREYLILLSYTWQRRRRKKHALLV